MSEVLVCWILKGAVRNTNGYGYAVGYMILISLKLFSYKGDVRFLYRYINPPSSICMSKVYHYLLLNCRCYVLSQSILSRVTTIP